MLDVVIELSESKINESLSSKKNVFCIFYHCSKFFDHFIMIFFTRIPMPCFAFLSSFLFLFYLHLEVGSCGKPHSAFTKMKDKIFYEISIALLFCTFLLSLSFATFFAFVFEICTSKVTPFPWGGSWVRKNLLFLNSVNLLSQRK